MYDELVKILQTCAERDSCIGWREACPYLGTVICDNKVEKAADAIEELSRLNAEITKRELKLRMDKPRWIPVTDRLPEAERKSYWVCTDTGYQCECRWTNNRFGIGELDKWGWSIFDIPQYQKVIAWMPLPCPYEPPKEEQT